MERTLLPIALVMLSWTAKAQNDCATALDIDLGVYTVTLIDGTELPNPICALNGTDNLSAAEWYTFTASEDTAITVSTDLPQNAGGDTRFH
ncbi:MAG TPA: hypothetical protein VHL57_13115, partial [Flavobacteriales bacterium]|nr:hypothetical protein [Flavobacteriales bacterium]